MTMPQDTTCVIASGSPCWAGLFRELWAPAEVFILRQEAADRLGQPAAEADPDLAPIMAARDGDHQAFEAIVRKYQASAYNIALRMLSDREEARDLTQEVFIKVYRSLDSFRAESRFSHWFYTVLLNTCRSRLKHLKRRAFFKSVSLDTPRREDEDPPMDYLSDPAPDASAALEQRQMQQLIEENLKAVPEEFRDVLVLRDIQGFAYEEIAAVLRINVGTVKSRLHRGRRILKDLMASHLGETP